MVALDFEQSNDGSMEATNVNIKSLSSDGNETTYKIGNDDANTQNWPKCNHFICDYM